MTVRGIKPIVRATAVGCGCSVPTVLVEGQCDAAPVERCPVCGAQR